MGARRTVRVIIAEEDRPRAALLLEALGAVDDRPSPDAAIAEAAVLVASRHATRSAAVDAEVSTWMGVHDAAAVLVVLLDGELAWDDQADTFDSATTTAISPVVQRCFHTRPLWLEARAGITTHVVVRVVGAVTSRDPRCPRCARIVGPDDDFCHNCGAFLAPLELAAGEADSAVPRVRRRTGWVLAAVVLVLAISATVIALLVDGEPAIAPTPTTSPPVTPPTTPDGRGWSFPWWLALPVGLGVGFAAGVWLTKRRQGIARSPTVPDHEVVAQPIARPARPTVFISHHFDADHEVARRFADDLGGDVDVWIAPECIEPGASWVLSIDRGLRSCQLFLALLSRAALSSPWVLREVQAAMELEARQELRLVPVRLDDCEIPILLRTYQTLHLTGGYPKVIEETRRLVATLT